MGLRETRAAGDEVGGAKAISRLGWGQEEFPGKGDGSRDLKDELLGQEENPPGSESCVKALRSESRPGFSGETRIGWNKIQVACELTVNAVTPGKGMGIHSPKEGAERPYSA